MASYLEFEKPIAEIDSRITELESASGEDVDLSGEIEKLREKRATLLGGTYARLSPWQKTQVARHPGRPHFRDYVANIFDDFVPLGGDRYFAEDEAIIGGLAKLGERRVVLIGHEKGHDTESRLRHNFGMGKPEGYRKAIRLMDLAGRFGLPVVTLVDTSGAFPGIEAEERGQAEAIARSTEACLALPVPMVSAIVGEGGSGGGASPDIARLYGRRHLRVKEIPRGEDLREELVKEVTGGEELTARDLFSGYFDFRPIFTAHMSGNGYPKITGTDNGIWRRMAVIHWPVKLDEKEQRDFEDVVSEFEPEYSGILNWLIAGVQTYLDEGLVIPEAVKVATQEYRDEMDPTSAFCAACVMPVEGSEVAAPASAPITTPTSTSVSVRSVLRTIAPTSITAAVPRSFERSTSPLFAASRRRFSVGANVFSPAVSLMMPSRFQSGRARPAPDR